MTSDRHVHTQVLIYVPSSTVLWFGKKICKDMRKCVFSMNHQFINDRANANLYVGSLIYSMQLHTDTSIQNSILHNPLLPFDGMPVVNTKNKGSLHMNAALTQRRKCCPLHMVKRGSLNLWCSYSSKYIVKEDWNKTEIKRPALPKQLEPTVMCLEADIRTYLRVY